MSANDFHRRWSNTERELGYNAASEEFVQPTGALPAALDDDSRSLLEQCGLPRDAGPFLSFEDTARMPRVYEVFSPGTWTKPEIVRLGEYRMLGSDGAGNALCLHERSGEVWLLDHEDHFRTRQFMNSSVARLAECLLAYMAERDGHKFCGRRQQDR